MNWTDLDWDALNRLREGFLSEKPRPDPYWDSESALASYDLTYGERIGWKWDQVLRELEMRGWGPEGGVVLDWGCGSGVASRRVLSRFGEGKFSELVLWDHSPTAIDFAAKRAASIFPTLRIREATPSFLAEGAIDLLLISHVLNELDAAGLAALRATIARAGAVLWVESGSSAVSQKLGGIRDELSASFRVIAPCTHQLGCPMFAAGNERHWCHFFAPPPAGIFADGNWVKFGQRAGIDLRSLAYSFVALEKSNDLRPDPLSKGVERQVPLTLQTSAAGTRRSTSGTATRVIGRPEHFKPYARYLGCDERGLHEVEVPKRTSPELYKLLERTKEPLVLDSPADV